MSETKWTKGPWEIPVANLFRVVAPEAQHMNEPSGMAPPYPWAVVAETDPKSVGGVQANANALLICAAPALYAALERLVTFVGKSDESGAWLDEMGMRFYRETGVWPHFKSPPLEMHVPSPEAAQLRWTAWIRAQRDAAVDEARRVLDLARGATSGQGDET